MVGAEEVVDGGCFASGKTLRNREHQENPRVIDIQYLNCFFFGALLNLVLDRSRSIVLPW